MEEGGGRREAVSWEGGGRGLMAAVFLQVWPACEEGRELWSEAEGVGGAGRGEEGHRHDIARHPGVPGPDLRPLATALLLLLPHGSVPHWSCDTPQWSHDTLHSPSLPVYIVIAVYSVGAAVGLFYLLSPLVALIPLMRNIRSVCLSVRLSVCLSVCLSLCDLLPLRRPQAAS